MKKKQKKVFLYITSSYAAFGGHEASAKKTLLSPLCRLGSKRHRDKLNWGMSNNRHYVSGEKTHRCLTFLSVHCLIDNSSIYAENTSGAVNDKWFTSASACSRHVNDKINLYARTYRTMSTHLQDNAMEENRLPVCFPDHLPPKTCLITYSLLIFYFLLPNFVVLTPLTRKEDHADRFPGSLATVLMDYPKLIHATCQPGFFLGCSWYKKDRQY